MSSQTHDILNRRILAVCEACGEFIEYWGFKSIHGKVWAYLALSTFPRSQSHLAKRLGVSRALVNMAIADLQRYGLVKAANDKHHSPYQAVLDVWPIITDVLRNREWILLEKAKLALEAALISANQAKEEMMQQTEGTDYTQASQQEDFNIERLEQLLQMTQWSQNILKILINVQLPQPREKWTNWIEKAMKVSLKIKSIVH